MGLIQIMTHQLISQERTFFILIFPFCEIQPKMNFYSAWAKYALGQIIRL